MATSWAAETEEKVNYTKLCRLLYDGGTDAVRSVFDGICAPASLTASLNANKPKLLKLKKPKGKVLSNDQWDKLYPPSGASSNSNDFDITLLFVLLRNICGLTRPATGWDALPPATDTSIGANLAMIKFYRNNVIAHSSKAAVDDICFEAYWKKISIALVSLGLKQDDIDHLKSSPLGFEDYNQLLEDWSLSDEEIKRNLKRIAEDVTECSSVTKKINNDTAELIKYTSDIKTDTEEIRSSTTEISKKMKEHTEKIKKDTAEVKTDTEQIKSRTTEISQASSRQETRLKGIESELSTIRARMQLFHEAPADVSSEVMNRLAHFDFTALIEKSCKSCHQSTRQWIFNKVEQNVKDPNPKTNVTVIKAGPGMGKTVVAAKICEIYREHQILGGSHFFQHSNTQRSNPKLMLQSIAKQLCYTVPGYHAALEAKLKTPFGENISDLKCEELFVLLFEEPLSQLHHENNVIIVIDALDECASEFKKEILDVLQRKLSYLPSWLRFVITTRPPPSTSTLRSANEMVIDPSDPRNLEDLKAFVTYELRDRFPKLTDDQFGSKPIIDKLMEISEGLFLVAFFLLEMLTERNAESPLEVLKHFPPGISSVYVYYFPRIQECIKPYLHSDPSKSKDEGFYKMLEAVVAATSPIPKKMFYDILGLKSLEEVERSKRLERNDAVAMMHAIFPVENDHVSVFHKSVSDWLTLDGDNTHCFSVSANNGREVLAQKSYVVLRDFKAIQRDLNRPLTLLYNENYAFRFGIYYVGNSSVLSQSQKNEVTLDVNIMAAILSMNHRFIFDIVRPISSYGFSSVTNSFSMMLSSMDQCAAAFFRQWSPFEDKSVYYNNEPSFGQFLGFVGDFLLCKGQLAAFLMTLLPRLENRLPHYNMYPVAKELPSVIQTRSWSSSLNLFPVLSGFVAVNVVPDDEPDPTTAVLHIRDDGNCGENKTFVNSDIWCVSPDNKFLIITEINSNKLKLIDVTSFENVKEYDCPVNSVNSCHVFGDDEQWYIVVKALDDTKVYILDGLNGQLHDAIEVDSSEEVKEVSHCGHILMTKTWKEAILSHASFTDDDGILKEVTHWQSRNYLSSRDGGITYRRIYAVHCQKKDVKFYFYPPKQVIASVIGALNFESPINHFKFSDDAKYLAYFYRSSVYIFNTSDETLLKKVPFSYTIYPEEIVFLSFSGLVVRVTHSTAFKSLLLFFDLTSEKLVYGAPMPFEKECKLVSSWQHTEKFPRILYGLENRCLTKFTFTHLE